jgi:hypothetical protein
MLKEAHDMWDNINTWIRSFLNKPHKIWLDHQNSPPDDTWTWAKTVEEAWYILSHEQVEELNITCDLGPFAPTGKSLIIMMTMGKHWPKTISMHAIGVYEKTMMEDIIHAYLPEVRT